MENRDKSNPELEITYPRKLKFRNLIGCIFLFCLGVGSLVLFSFQGDQRMIIYGAIITVFFGFGSGLSYMQLNDDPVHYRISKRGIEFRKMGFNIGWNEISEIREVGFASYVNIAVNSDTAKRLKNFGWTFNTNSFQKKKSIPFPLRYNRGFKKEEAVQLLYHYAPEKFHFQSYQFEEMVKSET